MNDIDTRLDEIWPFNPQAEMRIDEMWESWFADMRNGTMRYFLHLSGGEGTRIISRELDPWRTLLPGDQLWECDAEWNWEELIYEKPLQSASR